jgi:hypothetical protein
LTPEAATATPRLSKQQINDRFGQHTEHCVVCQNALKLLQQRVAAAQAAAAVLGVSALGVFLGVLLPKLLAACSSASSTAAPLAASAAAVSCAGVGVGVGVAAAVVLGAAAAIAMVVAAAATDEIRKFRYVEFSHADNH